MIILITGATHTGKTALAQRLMVKYEIPYLSIDHLKMGLIRSGLTSLTPEDDEELTTYLWPIVRKIIKTAIEYEYNVIVACYENKQPCLFSFSLALCFHELLTKQQNKVCHLLPLTNMTEAPDRR